MVLFSLNYCPIHDYRCPNEPEVNSQQNITHHTNAWMKITKITRHADRWTDGELNERLENNSPHDGRLMKTQTNSSRITRHVMDGWDGMDGELNERLENNSPHGWTPDGELNGRIENNC